MKDSKFHRLEAAGLNAIVNGLSKNLRNDRKLLQQSACIFDGLLALFAQQRARKVRQKSKK